MNRYQLDRGGTLAGRNSRGSPQELDGFHDDDIAPLVKARHLGKYQGDGRFGLQFLVSQYATSRPEKITARHCPPPRWNISEVIEVLPEH